MVAPTCFGITLPSSGSVSSAFWEMLNWGVVDRILWMGVLCLVTWCVSKLMTKWCLVWKIFDVLEEPVSHVSEVAGCFETSVKFCHGLWPHIPVVADDLLKKSVGSSACWLLRRNSRLRRPSPAECRVGSAYWLPTFARRLQKSASFPELPHQSVERSDWLPVCCVAEMWLRFCWARLRSANLCNYSVQNILSSSLLQKYKDIQNYNFACCFVWVWNLVAQIAGGT
jgi:hypothetical protein